MRASQPYTFIPKNGAPSVKGKILTRVSHKMRESVSHNTRESFKTTQHLKANKLSQKFADKIDDFEEDNQYGAMYQSVNV